MVVCDLHVFILRQVAGAVVMGFGCFYLSRDSSSCIALCSMHSPLAFTVALLVLLMTFSCMLVVFEVCCCSLLVK